MRAVVINTAPIVLMILLFKLAVGLLLRSSPHERNDEPPAASVPSQGFGPFSGDGIRITVDGWSPLRGHLDRIEEGEGYRAGSTLLLGRGPLELSIAEGTIFAFEAGLPLVREGTLEVRARREAAFGSFLLPRGGTLLLTPTGVTVGARGVKRNGEEVPAGTTIGEPFGARPRGERRAAQSPTGGGVVLPLL